MIKLLAEGLHHTGIVLGHALRWVVWEFTRSDLDLVCHIIGLIVHVCCVDLGGEGGDSCHVGPDQAEEYLLETAQRSRQAQGEVWLRDHVLRDDEALEWNGQREACVQVLVIASRDGAVHVQARAEQAHVREVKVVVGVGAA